MSLAGGGGRGRGVTAGRAGGPRWNRGANAPTRTGLPLRHPRGRTRVCRWHGAPLVDCSDGARTLHGVWAEPEAQRAADIKVPILMHHQFTADPDGVPTWLRDNYLYIGDFEQQIAYISDDHHHLLTWDELAAFVSGRLALPTGAVAHARGPRGVVQPAHRAASVITARGLGTCPDGPG